MSGIAMLGGTLGGGFVAQFTNLGVPYLVRAGLLGCTLVAAAARMKDPGAFLCRVIVVFHWRGQDVPHAQRRTVIGLLFLVGFRRRLIGTVTAFTLAHSITLACSVLGIIRLRSAPVEASIALSIVLVASEALRERDTLARRRPALVAFSFGLVHGLGFAGALADVGLPHDNIALPLLTFNLGVEIGQLLTLSVAYALTRALAYLPAARVLRQPALYIIGILAAYWSWSRILALGV